MARAILTRSFHAARPFADTSAKARTDFIGMSQFVLLSRLWASSPLRTSRRTSHGLTESNSAARAVVTSRGSGIGTEGCGFVFMGDTSFVSTHLSVTARCGVLLVVERPILRRLCLGGSEMPPAPPDLTDAYASLEIVDAPIKVLEL